MQNSTKNNASRILKDLLRNVLIKYDSRIGMTFEDLTKDLKNSHEDNTEENENQNALIRKAVNYT